MEKKDKRIYFDVFDLDGNQVEQKLRPNKYNYQKYHKNSSYILKCYNCGGKGEIVQRRAKHRNDKYNYYFHADHIDCDLAKKGQQKVVSIIENYVLNFSVAQPKNENVPGSGEREPQNEKKSNTNSKKSKYNKHDSELHTMTKQLYNDIVEHYNDEIRVKENDVSVIKKVKDIVISASKNEDYYGKRFNGNYIIVDFMNSDFIEKENKENRTCLIAFPQKGGFKRSSVLVKLHFMYEKDYDEFIQKKHELKKVRDINRINYKNWKNHLVKTYIKVPKVIPVFALDLKYNYELSQQYKRYASKAYDANVISGNIIWISEEEAI